ncbi:endolytic transglycosylase MltG [Patescibacteria group bacterium]|nr:endolytic transglycosylase MltG [Patescibacteria group bacterium]
MIRRTRILYAFLLLLLAGALGVAYLPRNVLSSAEQIFLVQRGEGGREIALRLEQEGLIWSAPAFRLLALTMGAADELQTGAYEFSPSMSSLTILRKMRDGDMLKERLTIPEGWNLRDIAWKLEGMGKFQAEELFEVAGFPAVDYRKALDLPPPQDFREMFPFLSDKPSYVGLEGFLFPDTYELTIEETPELLVRRMLQNFQEKYGTLAGTQGENVYEVVVMASLLEKEVQSMEDKRVVAGILFKRLEYGMPLQVDATISYITGERNVAISRADLERDSPYNTYLYTGLPLGPIANPGVESMEAALNPTESPYLYYLSTKEGETIFSRTLEEHNIAKARYLR